MTTLELITASLRLINELNPGQLPNAEEQQTGLDLLNAILENWEIQHRKVFVIDEVRFPLTSGVDTYTMGPGGDFDMYRPVKIQAANIIYSDTSNPKDGVSHALDLVNSTHFAATRERGLKSLRPLELYNDNDYPLLKLQLWPVPFLPA